MSSLDSPIRHAPALDEDTAIIAAQQQALTDHDIYLRLVSAILNQRLAPNTKLAEDHLAQIFGVSRTRIRPVLARLAGERIVTLTPNRGARVALPDEKEAREVFETRRLIEPRLLELFIQRQTPAAIAELVEYIESEEEARRTADRHRAIRLSGDFHLRIALHAGHETLGRILHEMVSRTSLVLMAWGSRGSPSGRESGEPSGSCASPHDLLASIPYGCNCREHRALLDAIRLRDVACAQGLMRKHLDEIEATLCFDALDVASNPLANIFKSSQADTSGLSATRSRALQR